MSHQSNLIAHDIFAFLKEHDSKSILRFITCGSVDDGKSTLIGRLLWDSKMIFEDQLSTLEKDSKYVGTQDGNIDYALLLDGLEAEREQGITIDVAYRYFSTDKRKFIVADTPGHEEYTRNMATGASNADLAIILVDARKGILTQTKRHSYIVSLLGIRHVVIAINKMDLVDYDEKVFNEIYREYEMFSSSLNFQNISYIPISALNGDNIIDSGGKMNWYGGPSLMDHLENIEIKNEMDIEPLRFSVQWVNRPNLDFRGFSGTIESGTAKVGQEIVVGSSGQTSKIEKIVTFDGDLETAYKGDAVTLTLSDEIDISRGDVLASSGNRPDVADKFEANIIWMNDQPLLPGRSYILKANNATANVQISKIKHKVNVNTLEENPAEKLDMNEVGVCEIAMDRKLALDHFKDLPNTGKFIIIDRLTNQTLGAGMIEGALRRASNIHWQAVDIHQKQRQEQKGQQACVLWFTGLSGSGKSTIANLVEKKLFSLNKHTYLLDGDNIRHGINKDLGFSDQDRVENIRRVGEVSKLFVDAGLITLTAFISPFKNERKMVRDLFAGREFIEIFIDTPIEICEERDVKGLYAKARSGDIPNFTGISSPYEPPVKPDIHIKTDRMSAEEAAEKVVEKIEELGFLGVWYPSL